MNFYGEIDKIGRSLESFPFLTTAVLAFLPPKKEVNSSITFFLQNKGVCIQRHLFSLPGMREKNDVIGLVKLWLNSCEITTLFSKYLDFIGINLSLYSWSFLFFFFPFIVAKCSLIPPIRPTHIPQSGSPAGQASPDGAAVDHICDVIRRYQRAGDVVELLFSPLDCGPVLQGAVGRRAGGPAELRLRVDPLRATGDPVSHLMNIDFTHWSCRRHDKSLFSWANVFLCVSAAETPASNVIFKRTFVSLRSFINLSHISLYSYCFLTVHL